GTDLRELPRLGDQPSVTALAWSPDARFLAIADKGYQVRVVNPANGSVYQEVRYLVNTPDGLAITTRDWLMTGDTNRGGLGWDLPTSRCVYVLPAPRGDDQFFAENAAVALSRDGRLLAYASGGLTRADARVYDVGAGKELARWDLPGGYEQLAALPGGRFLLV